MTDSPSTPTAEAPIDLDRRRVRAVFGGLLLAMLLASLDQTIVSTALPTIVGDLGGLAELSWVVTAYLLAATIAMPLWGRLSDLHGRKLLFQAAIVVFLTGSALSGVAQTIGELIAFRALQGLGAGGLMTLAMAIVADLIAPRERGRYQGYIQMVFVLASVAGPLLGGLFVDHLSWRWVFYVNLPIGALALTVISSRLHLPVRPRSARIDYLGAAFLAAGLTCVLLVTTWGGQQYAWTSGEIIGLAASALLLMVAFVVQERRAAEPILPLRLFRIPVFDIVAVVLFLTTCSFFATIVFVPLYLQLAVGVSATASGLLFLPLLLGAAASTWISGRMISRSGRYKRFPIAGLALMAVGLLLLSRMDTRTSRLTTAAFLVVFGLGFGMVSQVLTVAIQNVVERRDLGIATASANLFRSLGGSVGVALFGAVFASRLDVWLRRDAPAAAAHINAGSLQASPKVLHSLPPTLHDGVAHAVAHSLQTVFLVAAPIAALALLVVLWLKEVPLAGPSSPRGSSSSRGESPGELDRPRRSAGPRIAVAGQQGVGIERRQPLE